MPKNVIPIMLWSDFDLKLTMQQKIEKAARYYFTKYACVPNVVTLPTSECQGLTEVPVNLGSDVVALTVRSHKGIQNNHMTITFEAVPNARG